MKIDEVVVMYLCCVSDSETLGMLACEGVNEFFSHPSIILILSGG